MADPVWYYARGDVERGPFTLTQIRALANASKLRPDDLVWKEGMENWTAAREVAELFPSAGLVGDQTAGNGAKVPVNPSAPSYPYSASTQEWPPETRSLLHRIGRTLTWLGVLLLLGTYGCESLGHRRVERLTALADLQAMDNAGSNAPEQQAATRAATEYRAASFTRGVAWQIGLIVLLAGAFGLLTFAEQFERGLGLGLILLVVYAALQSPLR